MVRRETKRRVKTVISAILLIFFAGILIFLIFNLGKSLMPFLSSSDSEKIVKPIGSTTTLTDLSNKLTDRRINMESIKESSESGTFIGQIKDGPKVYFSQNQNAEWQVNSLYLIVSRTTIDDKKPKIIDMRSARPIVKF